MQQFYVLHYVVVVHNCVKKVYIAVLQLLVKLRPISRTSLGHESDNIALAFFAYSFCFKLLPFAVNKDVCNSLFAAVGIFWKCALTLTPDPIRPTRRGPES